MKYWTTREGKKIKIKDMTLPHLYNTICFLEGHILLDPMFNKKWSAVDMVKRIRHLFKVSNVMLDEYHRRIKHGH